MDKSEKFERKANPLENANPVSQITFTYMFPIFKKTYKNEITEDDLFRPLYEHKSSHIGSKLEAAWKEAYRKYKKYALHIALFRVFGLQFILLGLVKLIEEVSLVILVPYSIGKIVTYSEESKEEVYYHVGFYVLIMVVNTFIAHPAIMSMQHLCMKLRIACSSLLYRKTLRLSRTSLGNTTVGQMVNLLSNDVSKFDQGFLLVHYMWVGPIQTAVGTYMLYEEIGICAFFGLAFLVSFIPLQAWLAKKTSAIRLKTALKTDERVRIMNEVISGIQVIKMYCWDKPFAKLVSMARKLEIKQIRRHAYILGIIYSFEIFISRAAIFISILGYVILGNYITAQKVFAVTAIYNVLKPVITLLFTMSISSLAEVNISIIRLQSVLAQEERADFVMEEEIQQKELEKEKEMKKLKKDKEPKEPAIEKNGISIQTRERHDSCGVYNIGIPETKIVLDGVYAKWLGESTENTLENISLSIHSKQFLAIIGPVGSGKSSIINVLLKELPITEGTMKIMGSLSYSSQEPWLFTGTIKDNILFRSDYDEERYEKVVEVCALKSDFNLFPYGDKTLVGEKGKALSGGQKARINLARCIYKKADIYLLDDPLSAVDTNVGKHLYDLCITDFLKNKICILITHQLQYIKNADKIIIMNDGKIQLEGKYKELKTSGLNFAKLLEKFNTEEHEDKKNLKSRQNSEMELIEEDDDTPEINKESIQKGSINSALYWQYFKAGGGKLTIFCMVFLFILCQVVATGGEYFVSYWVDAETEFAKRKQNNLLSANETFDEERQTIIYIYSGITLGTIIIALLKSLYFMVFFTVASMNLHNFIFSKIIKATMQFYNQNPSGRILNRFSKDIGTIDEYIPSVLIDVVEIALLLFGVITVSAIVNLWLLLPSAILLVCIGFIRIIYIKTSRCVKRLESITKSPMFTHVTASINGLTTIRAFNAQEILIKEFDEFQDHHSSAWFLFIASSRCFGFWLDIICTVFIGVATYVMLVLNKDVQGGEVGLVITQFMALIGFLQWGIRQWSELENQMTSVERVLEYTKLESEPERKEDTSLSADWPQHGAVEFRNVSLKYNPNEPYVLKQLNFQIKPKEKVGIVGRTGAGKSSTISVLFQLYPLEGSIIIDGVDTTKLPLDQVRSKISIIPQEPVLFSGTMRKNLDPFEEYDDATLWNALEQVELKDEISEMPSGLNSNVSEGGANFSVGQRQLVCLARALIRNNKILVLDEATANVDPHTDNLIQETIRNKFADCTVLTIAHRLHTVMDSDKILVMQAGEVKDFDHPHILLKKQEGIFYDMVQVTGTNSSKNLEHIAKENFIKKKTE